MKTITVFSSITGYGLAIIFLIIFLSILMYLIVSASIDKNEENKMKRAKKMIEDGHKKATNGKKDDGIYAEIKKTRSEQKCAEQEIADEVKENMNTLLK